MGERKLTARTGPGLQREQKWQPVVFRRRVTSSQTATEKERAAAADRAAAAQAAADRVSQARARTLLAKVEASDAAPPLAWNAAFARQRIGNATLAAAFRLLHDAKQYDTCVEGLLAAIRNDHGQPWMYDVLAVEMQLAGRPQKEIDRVLRSRIDFTDGNEAQMLVTASMLSQFGAWEPALQICREAAKRNPWQPATWTMARSIADRSGITDAIVWSRVGTLRHIWVAGHESLHEVARTELQDLADKLAADGQTADAESVRAALAEALVRDLRISIAWAGSADLDLIVEEPHDQTCSYKSPLTSNGGVLIRQSDGSNSDSRGRQTEEYVCVAAPQGDYTVRIRNFYGRLITGKVLVKVTRHEGTDREKSESRLYEIGSRDFEIKVPLKNGRGR
ncbi:MAG: hypothetical protein RIK87_24015 [Fuerstiella sp.]